MKTQYWQNKSYAWLQIAMLLPFMALLSHGGCEVVDPDPNNPGDPVIPEQNLAPKFLSDPPDSVGYNELYYFLPVVEDGNGDDVTLTITKPGWLIIDADGALTGTPGWRNIGTHSLSISATDGELITVQNVTISVHLTDVLCSANINFASSSDYVAPYLIGKSHSLSNGYCSPTTLHSHDKLYAYDFDLAVGDTIVAMRAGKVIDAVGQYANGTQISGEENLIYIMHTDGTVAEYMNLTQNGLLVDVNQNVAQGQPIGLAGASGETATAQLHVAIYRVANQYDRKYSLPINFQNSDVALDDGNVLIPSNMYLAKSYFRGTEDLLYEGSWISGYPSLGQDGLPRESEHFIAFSDNSSWSSKGEATAIAEVALADILLITGLTFEEFTFLPEYTSKKIHIMLDFEQRVFSGLAYRDGVIITALDSPLFTSTASNLARWQRVIQHEIIHVSEFLVITNRNQRSANFVWLREGYANYGSHNHGMLTIGDLDAWVEKMQSVAGGGNPISIKVWSDFPQSVTRSGTTWEYYPSFELATHYLLDPAGNGTTITDLIAYHRSLGNGDLPESAFQTHFGLSVADFEAAFWDIMRAYLTEVGH